MYPMDFLKEVNWVHNVKIIVYPMDSLKGVNRVHNDKIDVPNGLLERSQLSTNFMQTAGLYDSLKDQSELGLLQ